MSSSESSVSSDNNKNSSTQLVEKSPVNWIPFGIASVGLIFVALYRFSSSDDGFYFITLCLIAFALAVLPWISTIKIEGLLEIERAIDHVRNETRDRIENVQEKAQESIKESQSESLNKIDQVNEQVVSLRQDFVTQISDIKVQMAQNTQVNTATAQSVNLNLGVESVIADINEAASDAIANDERGRTKEIVSDISSVKPQTGQDQLDRVDNQIDVDEKLLEDYAMLRRGFAQATAIALKDPLGSKCSTLIHRIPSEGLLYQDSEFDNSILAGIKFGINREQLHLMTVLKLVAVTEVGEEDEDENKTLQTLALGQIYSDYWKPFRINQTERLESAASAILKVSPIIASLMKDVSVLF